MNRKRVIILSVIAAAVVVAGASISFNYLVLNNDNREPDPDLPKILDSSLGVEKVISGLASPTSMAFLDNDDILILEKDSGNVRFISNGVLEPNPVFHAFVESNNERGLLGVAIANSTSPIKTVFLYYTEAAGEEVRNRVYRYEWNGTGNIIGGTLILDLPGTPGPNHDGGKMTMGPDGMLYAVIGDLNRDGVLQNYNNGPEPDDTSVIFRVDHNGNAGSGMLSGADGLSKYYAYGIRNSFGMDFDPLTGVLWDTENGPADYDEINVVRAGFNSGWEQVMGPIERKDKTLDDLVRFEGSHYADPVFSWRQSEGITDIEFLNSTNLGEKYAYNIFVGDFNNGNLYFFTINDKRTGLVFDNVPGLQDLVADTRQEVDAVTFGTGFGAITDIETGPDGYLYILTFGGDIYRIVPADKGSR